MKAIIPVLLIAFVAVGCAAPVFTGEVTVKQNGSTVYSSLDVRLGEVVFPGLSSAVATEADVHIDGRYLFTLHSGSWTTVRVDKLGEHTYLARVYLVQGGKRADYIGCAQGKFHVEPRYRSSHIYGHWWRLEIPQPYSQC